MDQERLIQPLSQFFCDFLLFYDNDALWLFTKFYVHISAKYFSRILYRPEVVDPDSKFTFKKINIFAYFLIKWKLL